MNKLLPLLFLSLSAFSQGVNFISGNLRTAFDLAKSANKPVFIEVFSPTCHVCASFVPTFENANVGQVYNQNFISYRLDVNSPEAQGFLGKQRIFVPSLPLLMFFGNDVSLLHAVNVNNSPNDLLTAATNALNPAARAAGYKSRFQKGERSPNFLIEHAYFSRIVRDTVSNLAAVNAYVQTQPKSAYGSPTNFLVLQKLVMDTDNPLFQYFINHLPDFQKAHGAQPVREVAENIVMGTLFSGRAGRYSPQKIQTLAGYLTKLGLDKRTVENRTLIPTLNALLNAGQVSQAVQRASAYLNGGPAGPREAIFLAKYFTDRTSDASALTAASGWLTTMLAKPGATPEEKADLTKQLAETKRKAGR
jgi:thiol-disulfide isomerase/thioredoxin